MADESEGGDVEVGFSARAREGRLLRREWREGRSGDVVRVVVTGGTRAMRIVGYDERTPLILVNGRRYS